MRELISLISFAISLFLFCHPIQAQNTSESDKPATIGIIIPSSGMFEMQGVECRKGYEQAYNLKPIELKNRITLTFEDDQSLPKNAVSAFQKLSSRENLLAVTAFGSSSALAISDLSNIKKIPVIALSAHPDFTRKTKLGFSHWLDASFEAEMFLKAFARDNVKRLAMVTYENDYPLAIRETILARQSQGHATQVVFDEKITEQSDYRGLIPKLLKKRPDAIFLNVLGPSFAQITRLLFEGGFRGQKYSLNTNARHDYLMAAGIPASDGFIFFGPDFTEDFYASNLSKDIETSAEHSYSFSCFLGMTFLLDTAWQLQQAGNLTKKSLNQALIESDSIHFPGKKIPIKNQRIIYEFTELVSNKGLVKLKANS
jgi:ABC-type branched-subunit amino acid transport system substrate-binding protein